MESFQDAGSKQTPAHVPNHTPAHAPAHTQTYGPSHTPTHGPALSAVRLNSELNSPRTIRGRDQHGLYESRFVENNVNNSNSKPIVSRENANNSNSSIAIGCRRSDLDGMAQVNTSAGIRSNFRIRSSDGDVKNSNIITIVNNSIDFEKNLLDADRIDSFSPPSSSSSNNSSFHNSSFHEAKDTEPEVIQPPEVKEAGSLGQGQKCSERTKAESEEKAQTPDTAEVNETIPKSDAASSPAFGCPKQNQVFQTLKGIQQLRRDGNYADLTVRVGGENFRCHKLVLASSSSYLKALIDADGEVDKEITENKEENLASITNDSDLNRNNSNTIGAIITRNGNSKRDADESKDEHSNKSKPSGAKVEKNESAKKKLFEKDGEVVKLENINPRTFEKILDFAYCVFDDVISTENALELLLVADRLQMSMLSQTCASYIAQTMSLGNVFEVIRLYDAGCAGLLDQRVLWKTHQVLRENFLELATNDDFLCLSSLHVRALIEESMMHVSSEMQVLNALLRWVKYKPEERSADMTLMLQHIRFPLMTSPELDKVLETSPLKENKLAKALVKESRVYSSLDYTSQMNWPRQNAISRRLFPTRDFILWTADRDKGLHFYSVIDGAHHKVTSFTNSRLATAGTPLVFDSTASVCCYDTKIYFSGGEFMTDKLWSVDSVTGQVTVLAQMPRGRKYHSMVATRGCIYCLGGQDKRGYTVLDCVDCYVISKDTWVKAGKLAEPAYNMAAVVCDTERRASNSGGAIYLLGGEDYSGKPLRLIQCFEWLPPRLYSAFKVTVSGMPPSLFSARAVTSGLDSLIYVVCGDGEVYKFESEKSIISHVTTIKNLSDNPRQRFGLAHVGGRLIVLGGHQLGHAVQEPIRSVCLDIAKEAEIKEFSPLLPGDNVNNCLAAKLSTNTLNLFL